MFSGIACPWLTWFCTWQGRSQKKIMTEAISMEDLWLRQSVHGWLLFLGIKSVYSDKSERNYRGKCLGWPVTSYSGAWDCWWRSLKNTVERQKIEILKQNRTIAEAALRAISMDMIILYPREAPCLYLSPSNRARSLSTLIAVVVKTETTQKNKQKEIESKERSRWPLFREKGLMMVAKSGCTMTANTKIIDS